MHRMNQLDDISISYLIKFRRAKTPETLEIMANAAERSANYAEKSAIAKAFVEREKEINKEASY